MRYDFLMSYNLLKTLHKITPWNQEKATYAGTMAKSALLLDAVKEAEGWTTDDQDYQQILNDEAANANMSQEDFLKAANDYYGEDTVVRNIMMERMIN